MLYYVTLLFQSFLLYAASGHHLAVSQAVRFLCDAQRLVHETVWQQVELILGEGEYEVVAVVAAEGEGAVVLAEDGCVARQGAQRRQSRVYTGVGRHPRAG